MSEKIIYIGDYQFSRERYMPRYFRKALKDKCPHYKLALDDNGHHVKCKDCQTQLSAYWVLEEIIEEYNHSIELLRSQQAQFEAERKKEVHLLAAQKVEKAWRSRWGVPTCPHCHKAIFPTDGFGGSMTNKQIELQRRESK